MCKENREFTRLAIHAKANMLLADQAFEGEVENLSLKGAFIITGRKLRLNEVVSITIDDTLACGMRARVVRVTDKGMGPQFERNLLD